MIIIQVIYQANTKCFSGFSFSNDADNLQRFSVLYNCKLNIFGFWSVG